MKSVEIKSIGLNKGAPRVWLQGKQPKRAGFVTGQNYSVEVIESKCMVALKLCSNGTNVVCGKEKNGEQIPVIDLNSKKVLGIFEGMDSVRVIIQENVIYILPLASELRKKERMERLCNEMETSISMGSISHGGGILSHAIHKGLALAGVKSHLAFANDIDESILMHAQSTNDIWTDSTQYINMPMQELAFDEYASSKLSKVSILELGIPCAAHSVAARAKKKEHTLPEDDPIFGHLAVGFLAIVAKINPAAIILENVVPYMASASMSIIKNQLADMGYDVSLKVLKAADWNCIEARERMCMVAMTSGIDFDFNALESPEKTVRKLSEIMDDVSLDDKSWSTMDYLKVKEVRDAEKGSSFAMQIFDENSEKISTLRKGYHKNGSSDPKIRHPKNPELLRLLNQFEHARCKDIPEHLVEGLSKTAAHEILGQSISYPPFVSVGKLVGTFLKSYCSVQPLRLAA